VRLRCQHDTFSQCHNSVDEIPNLVQSCQLPVIVCSNQKLVISGLCSSLRYIVRTAQQELEDSAVSQSFASLLKNLLGLHQNCLRACAEVSEWTLYTEVTLPQLVEAVLNNSSNVVGSNLPGELVQLENELAKPPIEPSRRRNRKHHTGDTAASTSHAAETTIPECGSEKGTDKPYKASEHLASARSGNMTQILDNLQLADSMEEISGRLFVEGNNVQLTDLVLFVCIRLMSGNQDFQQWLSRLPRVESWYRRMAVIPNISDALHSVGLFEYHSVANDVAEGSLTSNLSHLSSTATISATVSEDGGQFSSTLLEQSSALDSAHARTTASDQTCIQHTEKTKFHVSQGVVDAGVAKATEMGLLLDPLPLGNGGCLQLPWQQYPSWVLPCGVPDKRATRKLQQLENIAAAVKDLIRSTSSESSVIVDFCSGGGHVGILLAYLFPSYQVC